MNILVSACLLGVECRYDGKGVLDPAVKALLVRKSWGVLQPRVRLRSASTDVS